MEKSVQITLIISFTVILLFLISIFSFSSFTSSKKVINSNGYAEISVMPDLVTINFNIQTKGNTTKEANEKNKEILSSFVKNIVKQGFKESDIKTIDYSIYPEYEWSDKERKQTGYTATQRIKIEIPSNDSKKISSIIDAGVNAGASLSYINFELTPEKQNEYKAQAIKLASQDARQKAEAMAEGLNKRIGDLISVSNSNFNYSPWLAYSAKDSSGSLGSGVEIARNINPTDKKITASVSASFEIK